MQTNCSALNECVSFNYPDFKQDYCKISTFTGEDLGFAIRCSPFFGQSGLISFNNRSLIRTTIPMNVIQVQNGPSLVKIGIFANGTETYYNNEYFVDGQVPLSSNFVMMLSIINLIFFRFSFSYSCR